MSTGRPARASAAMDLGPKSVMLAAALLYLLAVVGAPETVRGWANHDDLHFLRMASHVLSGNWFGPYDQMTLMKGPTYPLFIALNSLIGLPLLLTSQLIYLAACYATSRAIALYRVPAWASAFVFIILILHPVGFIVEMFVVLRTSLYLSLTLASCAAWIAIPELVRLHRSATATVVAMAGGFCFAAFWMLREEGIWLVPAFLLLPVAFAVYFWRTQRLYLIRRYVTALCTFAGVVAVLYLAISVQNYRYYRFFGTADMKGSSYQAAYAALARVEQSQWTQYLPVPAEVREKVYAVSPSFREIQQNLEASGFKRASCNDPVRGHTCGDFASSWFLFALRDAVASSGYYKTGATAEAYYSRLSSEINGACRTGALKCNMTGYAFIPPINWPTIKAMEPILENALTRMAFLSYLPLGPAPSAAPELFPYVAAITHDRIAPTKASEVPYRGKEDSMTSVTGWVNHPDGPVDIAVEGADGVLVSSKVTRQVRPDVTAALKLDADLKAGFTISYACSNPCYVVFRTKAGNQAKIPVPENTSNKGADVGGFTIRYDVYMQPNQFDSVVRLGSPEETLSRQDRAKAALRRVILQVYVLLLPVLIAAAAISLATCLIGWWRNTRDADGPLTIVCGFFATAWICRIALITILDTVLNGTTGSSYDYLSPSFHMWVLFLGISILLPFSGRGNVVKRDFETAPKPSFA